MDTKKPLLSGTAALIVGTIGGIAVAASAFLPDPWNKVAMIAGFIVCVIAGVAAPMPSFAAGKPILQGAGLTVALSLSTGLEQFYHLLPDGWPRSLALGAAALLAFLCGKAAPSFGAAPQAPAGPSPQELGDDAGGKVVTLQDAKDVLGKGPQP